MPTMPGNSAKRNAVSLDISATVRPGTPGQNHRQINGFRDGAKMPVHALWVALL